MLRKEIVAHQGTYATNRGAIASYIAAIALLESELSTIQVRYSQYLRRGADSAYNSWYESDSGTTQWTFGITDYPGVESVYRAHSESGACCKYRRHTFSYNDPAKKIIGYTVNACWKDGTCGQWYRVGGGLLSNQSEIHIESWLTRGFSWTVTWYVVANKEMDFV